jgi:hypothetical protein
VRPEKSGEDNKSNRREIRKAKFPRARLRRTEALFEAEHGLAMSHHEESKGVKFSLGNLHIGHLKHPLSFW